MPLIEAFLALALTMLSLAMIATMLVEFFHRLARTRAKDLKAMLEEFYDSDLKPIVEQGLTAAATDINRRKQAFIEELLANPLIKKGDNTVGGRLRSNLRPLISLSTEDFFKRLSRTDVGGKIMQRAEDEVDGIVNSLTLAYEGYGAAATDLFKRRAGAISLAAGVIVALGLNVNALTVFQQYLDEPALRAKVVAQADTLSDKFQQRIDNSDQGFTNTREVQDFVQEFRNDLQSLQNDGLKIGYHWDEVPGRLFRKRENDGGGVQVRCCSWWRDLALWAVGVLATGLLIGLGGPFWFNIVRKLTEVVRVTQGGGSDGATGGGGVDGALGGGPVVRGMGLGAATRSANTAIFTCMAKAVWNVPDATHSASEDPV